MPFLGCRNLDLCSGVLSKFLEKMDIFFTNKVVCSWYKICARICSTLNSNAFTPWYTANAARSYSALKAPTTTLSVVGAYLFLIHGITGPVHFSLPQLVLRTFPRISRVVYPWVFPKMCLSVFYFSSKTRKVARSMRGLEH